LKTLISLLFVLASLPVHAASWQWPNQIKQDEQLIFFPAEAYYDANLSNWHIDVHGWIFEPEVLGEISDLFRQSLGLASDHDTETKDLFKKRAHWFIVDNERGKRIKIRLGSQVFELKPSTSNGHINSTLNINTSYFKQLSKSFAEPIIPFNAITAKKDERIFSGQIHLVPAKGISVISDIDDTIKVSNVTNKQELLANTFLRPFTAAPGMTTLYKTWQTQDKAVFHYVSASPWQLYPVLTEFMQKNNFPPGLFHMKSFRWKDKSFFNLFSDPIEYKIKIIESILQRYPLREFILVGDSGEKDPEVYGMITRKYPKQIKRILIRQVGNKNGKQRFTEAFAKIKESKWQVFSATNNIE